MKNIIIKLSSSLKELEEISKELATLPDGYLIKRHSSFYYATKNKQIGISRNTKLIKQLCRKRYLLVRKTQLENNITVTSPSDLDTRTPQELIASLPKAYLTTPTSYFHHPTIDAWLAKPQTKNNLYPESAIYTYNGINFRSLAERTIAEQLDKYDLLFQYEPRFDLGNKQVSPDFLIKNPFSAKTVIWEHFGAFNQEKYADSMNEKMDTYINLGFTQSENLIATYQYHIRKTQRIQELIEQIIL